MSLGKIIVTLLVAGVFAASAAPAMAGSADDRQRNDTRRPLVSNMDNQEKGPSFSSPQVKMHENGDRVSHYPPYYHPERSGNR